MLSSYRDVAIYAIGVLDALTTVEKSVNSVQSLANIACKLKAIQNSLDTAEADRMESAVESSAGRGDEGRDEIDIEPVPAPEIEVKLKEPAKEIKMKSDASGSDEGGGERDQASRDQAGALAE